MLIASKPPRVSGYKWLKENDPKEQRRKPKRHPLARRTHPVRLSKDHLFKMESAYLMSLPEGTTWYAHVSGNGVIVHIPGQAAFWRKFDGTIE